MPTVCCAIGCKHITGNGVCHLKRFPNDEKRAVIWAENVRGSKWRRKGWELLCDCHFESSQFEKTREDGAKKLRHNAIPTLFPTHTMSLNDSTPGLLEPSSSLECQYEPYDLEVLSDVGIQKLPDTVPLLFPEERDFFNEAHFEASAYELHRADGLRKLKQNAVPTIYVSSPIIRSKRKQIVQPRQELAFDESCDGSTVSTKSEAPATGEDEQFLNEKAYEYNFDGIHERPSHMKRLKTVHVMEIVTKPTSQEDNVERGDANVYSTMLMKSKESRSNEIMRETSEVLPVVKVKRSRHLKRRGRTKLMEKQCGEVVINNGADMEETKFDNEATTCPLTIAGDTEKTMSCFVCSKLIMPGYDFHLDIPAEASRTILHQCLEAVLSFESSVDCNEVVCRRCCSLLNYIDRTETELTILKGAISTCTKRKSERQDLQIRSKLMKSEQILDRFSRGLGERNYIMDLEELFLEKTDEENIHSESLPVAVEVKSLSEETNDTAEESDMFVPGKSLKEEIIQDKDDLGQVADQEGNKSEVTQREYFDQVMSESCSMGGLVGTSEASKVVSKEGVESISNGGLSAEIEKYSQVSSSERTAYIDEDLKHYLRGQKKMHKCKICSFKTMYESVMVWHLRVHMKTHRWCDFCCVEIPEKESLFTLLMKNKPPSKLKSRRSGSKHPFILPAVPVSPVPLSSLSVPLLPLDDVSSESPVILVDTQDLRNELIPESDMEKGEEVSVRMGESQDTGAVIVSENVLLSETTKLLPTSTTCASSVIDKNQAENYCNGTSFPDRQENETLGIYCEILRPPTVQIGKGDNSDADVELSDCLSNCCNVDGNDVESLSSGSCNVPSGDCVHGNDGLEDSMETNFLDTLTSQRVTKYPEILPEICDEASNQNTVSTESGVPDDNITNNDVHFGRNNGIGESDLALAYESSVAALMCQSDDSNGILY